MRQPKSPWRRYLDGVHQSPTARSQILLAAKKYVTSLLNRWGKPHGVDAAPAGLGLAHVKLRAFMIRLTSAVMLLARPSTQAFVEGLAMIQFRPMLGELALAHEGRWTVFAGIQGDKEEARRETRAILGLSGSGKLTPALHLMAKLAGMESAEYARDHSMLALHRVAAPADRLAPHGAPECATISNYLGMKPHRDGAYVCYDCIDACLASEHESSWFLRFHHVKGLDWCPEHGSALYEVNAPTAFDDLPHFWRERGKTVRVPAPTPRLPRSGVLQRYTAIATDLLSRKRPAPCFALNRIISDRAKDPEFFSRSGSPQLMSDLLLDAVDQSWLLRHVPEFANKRRGVKFHLLDSIEKWSRNAARGEIYVLALSILYPSVEAALLAIADAETTELGDRSKRTREAVSSPSSDDLWFGGMLPLYIELEGNVDAVAARLGTDPSNVTRIVRYAGVPRFHTVPKVTWNAFTRFMSGCTIRDACRVAGAQAQDLESLVRKCLPTDPRSSRGK